jgi:hypothetical protein
VYLEIIVIIANNVMAKANSEIVFTNPGMNAGVSKSGLIRGFSREIQIARSFKHFAAIFCDAKMIWMTVLFFCLATITTLQAQTSATPGSNTDSLKKEMAKQKAANKKAAAKIQVIYFVIKADGGTFGYDIYADGRQYIHQNTIPGMGGTKGFADTASAGRTARLVIKKIKEGENPPTVTEADLKKLKVIVQDP